MKGRSERRGGYLHNQGAVFCNLMLRGIRNRGWPEARQPSGDFVTLKRSGFSVVVSHRVEGVYKKV